MALILKDRVKEITTTTGTGDISLGGADSTFEAFSSYMADGDTTYYVIATQESGVDEWEVGIGTWNTGNTLSRNTVLAGSNGTSAVNFGTGDKSVFMSYPASKAVYLDGNGDIDINGGTIDGTAIGSTTAAEGSFTSLSASGNVDLEGYIDMNPIGHPTHSEGRVYYDNTHKTLSYQSDITDVEHELGIEEHVRVFNNTGSTIAKGKPVYWSGNQNDVPTIGLANATSETKYNMQGLTAGEIANNSYGYVIVSGLVTEIDTSALTAGDNVFLGLTDGALQNASPTYPNFPMCLGWVIKSDATTGIILVNQQNHSVNSFRVRASAHIGENLIIGGDLTVLGTQTIASSENVSIANAWNYFNSGDTIGALNTNFSGTGLNDASFTGHFTGTTTTTYYVRIDGVGTGTGGVDTFEWSTDNFATTVATGVDITGDDQLIHSTDNIAVKFEATTGHTSGDTWTGTATPLDVDTGFATNRNTGTSGVGYTHMGIYFDVSTGKWTVFDEYDPEPEGTIDTSDASFNYGILKAGTFEGDLSGNVTGNVTGTASSASALATARNIGGVSFDGTADINLPGVNTTGNQDTTGNAATATALETARTIQLSGDVTGSVTFDGSADVSITAAVQDDSHAHVISNVDGLQTALDAKADKTTTITSGDYLTGGGDLSSNRTLNVDATSLNTASKVVARDASGNFAAGTITAALSGNATTATALETARDISLTGAVTGSVSFDGSGNVSIATTATSDPTLTLAGDATGSATFTNLGNATLTVTVADDSHNHIISNVDGLQAALDAKQPSSTALTTSTTFGGDVSGTYNAIVIADDSHNHVISNVDGLQTALDGKLGTTAKAADSNLLDGIDSGSFLRSDANDTSSGTIAFGTGGLDPDSYTSYSGGFGGIADGGGWSARGVFVTGGTGKAAAMSSGSGNVYFGTQDGTNTNSMATWLRVTQSSRVADFSITPTVSGSTMWHAGNDGSGSGLDADTVDGIQASSFLRSDADDSTSGNLGIGTGSASLNNKLVIGFDDGSGGGIEFRSTTYTPLARIMGFDGGGNGNLRFYIRNGSTATEKMRLDENGNLLVGKTSADNTTAGHSLFSTGFMSHVRSGGEVSIYNRLSTEGNILVFRKDGTNVGSIGAEGGDLYIGTGTTNLRFRDADSTIVPHDGTAVDDDAISLGRSNVRFKNLYLSGGVNLDGSSVNSLYKAGDTLVLMNGTSNAELKFGTNNVARMTLDAVGNFIVGGNSANTASALTIAPDGNFRSVLAQGITGDTRISEISGLSNGYQISVDGSNNHTYKWHNGSTQSMTLDSSGNLLVATTDNNVGDNSGFSNSGFNVTSSGEIKVASGSASVFNRLGIAGSMIDFKDDGTTVGSIGGRDSAPYFAGTSSGVRVESDNLSPANQIGQLTDGAFDLGDGASRYRNIFLSGDLSDGTGNNISVADIVAAASGGGGGIDPIEVFSDYFVDRLVMGLGRNIGVNNGMYNAVHIGTNINIDNADADESVAVGNYTIWRGRHYYSTAIGHAALGRSSTSNPFYNVAVGRSSGSSLYSGDYNVTVGAFADVLNTGTYNGIAIGYSSKVSIRGVAIGYEANRSGSSSGYYNVAIGWRASYDNDGGDYNTAVGYEANYAGGTGGSQTFIGTGSGRSQSSGFFNTAIGTSSLYQGQTGSQNVAVGMNAGYGQRGSNNTLVGYMAGRPTSENNHTNTNVICLGHEATSSGSTITNEITLGNSSITSLRCNTTSISSLSDERDKTDIQDLNWGLDFINDLRPVSFTWNRRDGTMGATKQVGFIAQEVHEVEMNHSSTEYTKMVNYENPSKLELAANQSYPILVKAVQELSAKIEELEARLAQLEGN